MRELLKYLKALKAKGFATSEERATVASMVKELDSEDQEAVADQVEDAEALPEEDPEAAAEEEAEAEEMAKGIRSLITKELGGMKDEIKEFVVEQHKLAEKKAGIYHPAAQEKRKAASEMFRETFKALHSGDEAKLKEMSTDATGSPFGGYTVDSELSAEIRHLITQYGVARREMTAITLTKNSVAANHLVTDVTIYWVDEGAVIGSTEAVLGQKELTLKKLGAIVTMTSELLEDTEIDFLGFVGSRVAEGFARAEDQAFFNGDGSAGSGGFTGLLRDANVPAVTLGANAFNTMDADDLLDMIDLVPTDASDNGKFYYHRTIKSIVRKLKGTDGHYIYQEPSAQGPATVWGRPEVLVEAMPKASDSAASTAFVLYGDLRKAAIHGSKGAIKADRFNAGSVRNVANDADINLITTDREAVRWTQRVGYIVILPTAMARLVTSA